MNKKINNYINMKNKKNNKILDYNKDYKLDFIRINDNTVLSLSLNNKKILVGEYNFYGIYQPTTKLWIWAQAIPGINKKYIQNIERIQKLNYLFENDNDEKISFYYQLLTQNVILINNEKLLDWIKDLILYLSEDVLILTPLNSESNLQFITLKNIMERYN
jgi:hypothetical protein